MEEKQNRAVLLLVVLAQFMVAFMTTALFVSVPDIEQSYRVQVDQVCWIEIGYSLTLAAFCVPFGKISDLMGRRKMMLLGLIAFGAISFMCMYAYTMQLLIIFRAVQGVTAAMVLSGANAFLADAYPAEKRRSALGISVSATFVGMIVGPAAGQYLSNYVSWQSVFLTTAILAAVALLICVIGPEPDEARRGGSSSDSGGFVLLVLGIAVTLLSLSLLPNITATLIMMAVGAAILACFIYKERHTDDPMVRPGLISDRISILANSGALLCYAASCALSCLIGAYLRNINHAGSGGLSAALIWFCLGAAMFAPVAGKLADRHPLNRMSTIAMILSMVSCVMCFFLTKTPSVLYVSVLLLLAGAGSGIFIPVITGAVFSRAGAEENGVVNAILNTYYVFGQAVSMVILSAAFTRHITYVYDVKATGSRLITVIRIAAGVLIAIYGAAAFLSLMREQLESKESQKAA